MARPLKYKTVDELQAAIDQYFEDCKGKTLLDDDGNAVTDKYGNLIIVDAKPRIGACSWILDASIFD